MYATNYTGSSRLQDLYYILWKNIFPITLILQISKFNVKSFVYISNETHKANCFF